MSLLSDVLSQRDVNGLCSAQSDGHVLLEKLPVGQSGTVSAVCDLVRPEAARRLFDLGFVPGVPVTKRRQDLSGRTMVIEIGGYEIAMRADQARCIQVDTAVPSPPASPQLVGAPPAASQPAGAPPAGSSTAAGRAMSSRPTP
nr:hypothetical protein [Actinomycetales bacterium]